MHRLESRWSWVPIPPKAANFSLKNNTLGELVTVLTSVAVRSHIDPFGSSTRQRVATFVALSTVTVVRTITLGTWPALMGVRGREEENLKE